MRHSFCLFRYIINLSCVLAQWQNFFYSLTHASIQDSICCRCSIFAPSQPIISCAVLLQPIFFLFCPKWITFSDCPHKAYLCCPHTTYFVTASCNSSLCYSLVALFVVCIDCSCHAENSHSDLLPTSLFSHHLIIDCTALDYFLLLPSLSYFLLLLFRS